MTETEVNEIADAIELAIREQVRPLQDRILVLETSLAEREARISRLEGREVVRGERGEQGAPGESIVGPAGERGIDGANGRDGKDGVAGSAGQNGTAGRDGIDGTSGKDGDVGPQGAAGRDGVDGRPGERGADGAAGAPGKDGIDGKDGQRGEIGPAGRDGAAGRDGDRGADGQDGARGADGRSFSIEDAAPVVEAATERHFNKFAIELERRWQDKIERAIEKIPAPKDGRDGRDGKDALEIGDFSLRDDGDGNYALIAQGRELGILRVPGIRDAGVFDESRSYRKGDGVSHQGSLWIAQKDAPEGKPGGGDGWRLAVKSGRNGRDGLQGPQGPRGDPGVDRRYE